MTPYMFNFSQKSTGYLGKIHAHYPVYMTAGLSVVITNTLGILLIALVKSLKLVPALN